MAEAVVRLDLDPTGFQSGLGVAMGGLDRLRDSGIGTARGLATLDDRADAAADGMAQLARTTGTAGDQLDDAARGIARMDDGLRGLDANARRVDMVSDMAELAGEASQLADALGRVSDRVTEIGSGFESAQARISQVLTDANAIEGLGVSGTLEALGESALGAAQARVGSISPEAFANATYSGISAGLSASFADAQAMVSGVLGQATGAGVEAASSTLLTAFIALGDRAAEPLREMQAIADDLAVTQQLFRIEGLEQLQASLEPVAGLASAFGVSRDETLAAIGILNTALEGGAPAGTAFKSFLAQLPAAAEKLGIEVATTETGGVAVLETLERIQALGEGLGAAEFGALLSGALGTEAGPAAVALLGNLDQLAGAVDALTTSQGAAQTAAEKVAATFAAQQERLANTSEALQIRLSGGALAVQRWGLQAQQAAVDGLAWLTTLPGIGDSIAGVAGGALAASAGVAQFAAGGLELSTGILSTVTLLRQFGIAARLSAVASGVASIAARGLGAAMAFATGPIGLIIVGIGAAIAAGVLLARNWDRVSAFIVDAWERVSSFFQGLWDRLPRGAQIAIQFIFPIIGLARLIVRNWEGISGFFAGVWDGIRTAWETGWNAVLRLVQQFEPVVGFFRRGFEALSGVWDGAAGFMTGPWDGLVGVLQAGVGVAAGVLEALGVDVDALAAVFEGAVVFIGGLWDGLVGGITAGWETVRGIVEGIGGFVERAAGAVGIDLNLGGGEAPAEGVPAPAPAEPEGVAPAAPVEAAAPAGVAAAETTPPAAGGPEAPVVPAQGAAIPETIAEGVAAGEPEVERGFRGLLGRVFGRRLPSSDAEIGPLSRLTAAGQAIPTTMAEGVEIGAPALVDTVTALFAGLGLPAPAAEPALAPPGGVTPAVEAPAPTITVLPAEGVQPVVEAPGAAITVEPAGVVPAVEAPAPTITVLPAEGAAPIVVTGPAEGIAPVVETGVPAPAPPAPAPEGVPAPAPPVEPLAAAGFTAPAAPPAIPEGVPPIVTAPGAEITVEPAGVAPVVEAPTPTITVLPAEGVAPIVVTGAPAPAEGVTAPAPAVELPGAAPAVIEPGAPGEAPAPAAAPSFAPMVAVMRELIASSREQTAATREMLEEMQLKRLMGGVDEPARRAPNPRPWELRDSLGELDATVSP